MSERQALLTVQQVGRRYESGAVQALDGVTFGAEAGEVVALTGPSGCGKSTLLSILGLLDQPSAGRVFIGDQDLAAVRDPSGFRARHIGFVFQFHHMVPTMTLLENVAAPMIALGVPRARRNEEATTMLDRMGLLPRARFLPANVSGGERQRAAVARALINRPTLILADEPTGNLDSRNGRTVVDLLLEHAHQQATLVLIATHNPAIARVAHRCIELRDGRLVPPAAAVAAAPWTVATPGPA